ncbi:MAG: hypothetical protein QOG16_1352 [Actinomycetota bacterium]|nr:hypothetical protein [Actinomycetota bacterium]
METIRNAQDSITVKRVFGEAYEKDGLTVIPAAFVTGGGGGGGDQSASGTGFGLCAFPVGAYVIKDGDVSWQPAVNVNFLVLAGLYTLRTFWKYRKKRR